MGPKSKYPSILSVEPHQLAPCGPATLQHRSTHFHRKNPSNPLKFREHSGNVPRTQLIQFQTTKIHQSARESIYRLNFPENVYTKKYSLNFGA